MNDRTELFTIGQLSRRTGLPVRTIRFWSDEEIILPARRSAGGYRLYDVAAVARLDLIRTLRELGLNLETVRRVLDRQDTVADVARAHAEALDAEIRVLQLRRAVLRSVARRASTTEEMRLMHKLAQLSAQERQHIIDDFVDHTFAGLDPDAPGAHIARKMRLMPAELPQDPTADQVDAWVELAELVADEAFRQRVRQMAVAGAEPVDQPRPYDHEAVLEHGGDAVAAGITPDSAEGQAALGRIIDARTPVDERVRLAGELETFTDRRVERYWQLMGVVNGLPPFSPGAAAFEWLIAALRAHR
ncbi:MerR family transcriptional regulator [Streptosporangium sp. CA-135522]|uniref:helix-turn-helix domain-containing protein n=1 Tax=Streptosporangium sp. CA-135522 TaxID=3240072 RepID=UPI003D8B0683